MDDRLSARSWLLLALMVGAIALNYVDRQVLSIALPVIRQELGLDAIAYSRIVFVFLLAYAVGHPVGGLLLDRIGTRIGFALAVGVWSIAGMLHALAGGAGSFAACRFLLGFSEAGALPAAVKASSDWFPASFRATAVGAINNGIGIGAIAAPPLCAWLLLAYGWRATFVLTGALGLLWLVVWMLATRGVDRAAAAVAAATAADGGRRLSLANGRRVLAGLMIARAVADPTWYFYLFWLPDYLWRVRGFSLAEIGAFAWIPYLTANLGALAGGAASSALVARGWTPWRARRIVMAVAAAQLPLGILVTTTASAPIALALICFATFTIQVWATNLFTLPADLFRREQVAAAYGWSGAAGSAGAMLVTLVIGVVVQHLSYGPVLVAVGVMHPVALALSWRLIGSAGEARMRPVSMETAKR